MTLTPEQREKYGEIVFNEEKLISKRDYGSGNLTRWTDILESRREDRRHTAEAVALAAQRDIVERLDAILREKSERVLQKRPQAALAYEDAAKIVRNLLPAAPSPQEDH